MSIYYQEIALPKRYYCATDRPRFYRLGENLLPLSQGSPNNKAVLREQSQRHNHRLLRKILYLPVYTVRRKGHGAPFQSGIQGVLLADEVGLGKTIEAGLVLCQFWAEGKRRLFVVSPFSLFARCLQAHPPHSSVRYRCFKNGCKEC